MLNKCEFIGNLGADPEVRTTQSGGKVANLRLAVSETWKDSAGQKQERTEWVTVVIFNDGLVGVVERFLRKGTKVYICGKMQTRKWQDQSGNDRYSTEIVLQGFNSELIMLDSPAQREERQPSGGGRSRQPAPAFDDDLSDDVPF